MTRTPLYRAYSAATRVLLPAAYWVERRKVLAAGMGSKRAREKLGYASAPRPDGGLVWFHAASVGESLSVLSLIARMGAALPGAHVLITSGTPSSAALLDSRLPSRCLHQFAPLDAPGPVRRFLEHWRPDAAIFVESELWPQMVTLSADAGVPLALIGARMSDASLAGWRKRPKTARALLQRFHLIQTQTTDLSAALCALGTDPATTTKGLNLKSLSAPLPVQSELAAHMRRHLAGRPVWVAASTHDGEEDTVLAAHAALLRDHPDLCLILAPRHPDRAPEIAAMINARGWPTPRHSAGDLPAGPVFLADSLGELGTWYALTDIVFLGGSLHPIGGHNPYEVAQTGAAVASGPHVSNFADTFAALHAAGGAVTVCDGDELAAAVHQWLRDPQALHSVCDAAQAFAGNQIGQLDDVAADLIDALRLRPDA